MVVETRINKVAILLSRVKKYSDIVTADSFENKALGEMKDNVKDIIDEAKDEMDEIKSEVDNW